MVFAEAVADTDTYGPYRIPICGEAGTLAIDLLGTRSANSAGQTFDEAVTTIRSTLADRGNRDNRPGGRPNS